VHNITVDYGRDALFEAAGLKRLKDGYLKEGENSPQDRLKYVSSFFASNEQHAQRLYEYSSKHWLSYATPVLNFIDDGKCLPISCYLSYLNDSRQGLVETSTETRWLSMAGGGVGVGLGIRSSDNKSTGIMPHLKTYDADTSAYRQNQTRRGSYAFYLDISHPDIIQFLDMRKPTGDPNLRCLNLHYGVNITDKFMKIIEGCMAGTQACDDWELIDPHSSKVKEVVSAKALWEKILEYRASDGGRGEPYLHFIDTSNELMNPKQKEMGLKIQQSNLCNEIYLPTDKDRTAVCCLSSLNLAYFDTWSKDPKFIPDVMEMLDNVIQYFIDNAEDTISRAKFSASRERAVGLGALGFHDYLQSLGIPFESPIACSVNKKIFSHIKYQVDQANLELGAKRGEAPDMLGTGRRFSCTMAIAPNASTSIIMGNTSPGIEPYVANIYKQNTLSGTTFNKNKHLDKLLKQKTDSKKAYDDIWAEIARSKGSVSKIDLLDDWEKSIFKTAKEIDQHWVIQHAADRQVYIDQGQSVNLFFEPTVDRTYLHSVHFKAWKAKLKGLYYVRTSELDRDNKVGTKIERIVIPEDTECIACAD